MSTNRFLQLPTDEVLISPSILAADFANLGRDIANVAEAGADCIHFDVMDGHFVPNISVGPGVLKAVANSCDKPFDVHLMISEPEKYIDSFIKAGADHITIHVEIDKDIRSILQQIKAQGVSCGLSLKPKTPASALLPYLELVDLVLIMSVEPGFGGQSFMHEVMPKTAEVAQMIQDSGRKIFLEIDGGITPETAKIAVAHGAKLLVAGTSVFRSKSGMADAIIQMKNQSKE